MEVESFPSRTLLSLTRSFSLTISPAAIFRVKRNEDKALLRFGPQSESAMDELQIHIVDALRKQRDYWHSNIEIAKQTDLATNAITKIINGRLNPSAAFFSALRSWLTVLSGAEGPLSLSLHAAWITLHPATYELGNRVPGDRQLTQIR